MGLKYKPNCHILLLLFMNRRFIILIHRLFICIRFTHIAIFLFLIVIYYLLYYKRCSLKYSFIYYYYYGQENALTLRFDEDDGSLPNRFAR